MCLRFSSFLINFSLNHRNDRAAADAGSHSEVLNLQWTGRTVWFNYASCDFNSALITFRKHLRGLVQRLKNKLTYQKLKGRNPFFGADDSFDCVWQSWAKTPVAYFTHASVLFTNTPSLLHTTSTLHQVPVPPPLLPLPLLLRPRPVRSGWPSSVCHSSVMSNRSHQAPSLPRLAFPNPTTVLPRVCPHFCS